MNNYFIDDEIAEAIYNGAYTDRSSYEQYVNDLIEGFELFRIKTACAQDETPRYFNPAEVRCMGLALEYKRRLMKSNK